MLSLETPIEKLPKVGPRNLPRLKKLGVQTVKDLLWHFPSRYEDYSRRSEISEIQEAGNVVGVLGEVVKIKTTSLWRRQRSVTEAFVRDASGTARVVWFNQPYIENSLPEGAEVSLAGKVALDKRGLYISNPQYEKADKGELIHTSRLVPVYPETEGITSKYLRFLIKPLLRSFGASEGQAFFDPLPKHILIKYGFPNLAQAIQKIHFPESLEEAETAKKRLAFDELILFQLKSIISRRNTLKLKAAKIGLDSEVVRSFVASLPFELTNDQRVSAFEILKDLERGYPMNRLLNGDVGSGKTAVAVIAAYQTAKQKNQAVFMAPTEILAQQHFKTISEFLKNKNIAVGLLTGSGGKQFPTDETMDEQISKKLMLEKIARGEIDIVIGTHAVIQKDVKFKNLALVVIDEQHRFGINQRRALVRGSTQMDTRINADKKEDKLLYEELTYKIRGGIFNVYNTLGSGHKELVYHKAILEEFKNLNLFFETEKSIPINYGGKKIGIYKADLVVENSIIIELKALPFIGATESRQMWSYLKGSSYKVALLINFGPELIIKRVVYDSARNPNPRSSAFSPRESAQQVRIPHLLSMTATPIPRTLALTVYGDLDISLIKEKPKNRKSIVTKVVSKNKEAEAYEFLEKEIASGRQVFVICPRIELTTDNQQPTTPENKNSTNQKLSVVGSQSKFKLLWAEVKAVTDEHKKLSEKIFPHLKIAMLHGKMKPKEKEGVMSDFKAGKHHILVSTSVVEVGVDIPNASVMLIENAERFGLAQLHQFRGRVGRAEHQSYCLLVNGGAGKENRRLKALENCEDGFKLAEQDLLLRGPGEFVGTKQSGLPDLAMASLTDLELVKRARLEARTLLKEDPSLGKYPLLKQKMSQFQKLTHFE